MYTYLYLSYRTFQMHWYFVIHVIHFIHLEKQIMVGYLQQLQIYKWFPFLSSGPWQCSDKMLFRQVEVLVRRPEVRILGDPDLHVQEGSPVSLECVVTNLPQLLPFVSWFFNNEVRRSNMQIKRRHFVAKLLFSCWEKYKLNSSLFSRFPPKRLFQAETRKPPTNNPPTK